MTVEKRSYKPLWVLCAIVLVLLLTACGAGKQQATTGGTETGAASESSEKGSESDPTPSEEMPNLDLKTVDEVYEYVKDMDPEKRREVLLAGAKKEGGLIRYYSTLSENNAQQLTEAFARHFPDLELDLWRESGDVLLSRVFNEYRAGTNRVDVIDTKFATSYDFALEGILTSHLPPNIDDFPAGTYDPDGLWVAQYALPVCLAWNTELIAEEDVPDTWEDLADPKYNGIFSLDVQEDLLLYYWRKRYGDEEGLELARRIAANNPKIIRSRSQQAALLAAGEIAISAAQYEQYAIQVMEKGAPVDFKYLEGPVAVNFVASMLPKHAPHPYGALLLKDWLASPDGQQTFADMGRTTALPGMKYTHERQSKFLEEREIFELKAEEYGPVLEETLTEFQKIFGIVQ